MSNRARMPDLFLEFSMVASSVTGVSGPGDSNGKYKPKNNCSCSCCCGSESDVPNINLIKKGCYKIYKKCTSNIISKKCCSVKTKSC